MPKAHSNTQALQMMEIELYIIILILLFILFNSLWSIPKIKTLKKYVLNQHKIVMM